jgi:hypothetical protein
MNCLLTPAVSAKSSMRMPARLRSVRMATPASWTDVRGICMEIPMKIGIFTLTIKRVKQIPTMKGNTSQPTLHVSNISYVARNLAGFLSECVSNSYEFRNKFFNP